MKPTVPITIISGIISMYGDNCRIPVKIMIAIMPSMQPPMTHGSAFCIPDGGISTPRSSGGVTLISPGVKRGPRLMIGVNFLVVIRHLRCSP